MTNKFMPKPLEIEAMQYLEENRDQVIGWSNAIHTGMDDDGCSYELLNIRVVSNGSQIMVSPGDWIIKAGNDFARLTNDEFTERYERCA